MSAPYQVADPLTDDEYDALKSDIALRGVLVPVELDAQGNILDGHHRIRACEELGIKDYPRIIRAGLSEEEKKPHAKVLNFARRHMTRERKREQVRQELIAAPHLSDRQIARMVGMSHPTVADVRAELESTGKIYQLERTIGRDGKERPASRPVSVLASTDKEAAATLAIFDTTPELKDADAPSMLTVGDLRKVEKEVKRAKLDAIVEAPEPQAVCHEVRPGSWWRLGQHLLYCGDTSSDAFKSAAPVCPFAFADPPYNVGKAEWDTAFEWRHDWLCDVAEVVAVTPGISEFARFLQHSRMPYRWTFAGWIKNGMTRGAMGFGNTLLALLFAHGSIHRNAQDFMSLVVETGETEETDHPSRKPSRFVAQLLEVYTAPGDSVIDPFLGSGTTLFVAEQMGRAAYVGELNTDYCSEVIARWEAMTGAEAEEVRS